MVVLPTLYSFSLGTMIEMHPPGEVDAQSTVIIVAFLIAMTLGFEFAKDMAEEAVPREMRPVLGQIFSEFTVLGFMAMVTYFMIQANVLAAASSLVYHDPEHLVHLFEKACTTATAQFGTQFSETRLLLCRFTSTSSS